MTPIGGIGVNSFFWVVHPDVPARTLKELGAEMQKKHPSVGAVRSIGLFGIFELIRNRRTKQPMAPFNGASEEMAALGKFFRENGLYTLVRWNTFYTNPPLCINEQQLREAFALGIGDAELRRIVMWASYRWNSAGTAISPTIAALNDCRSSAGIQYSKCARPPASCTS